MAISTCSSRACRAMPAARALSRRLSRHAWTAHPAPATARASGGDGGVDGHDPDGGPHGRVRAGDDHDASRGQRRARRLPEAYATARAAAATRAQADPATAYRTEFRLMRPSPAFRRLAQCDRRLSVIGTATLQHRPSRTRRHGPGSRTPGWSRAVIQPPRAVSSALWRLVAMRGHHNGRAQPWSLRRTAALTSAATRIPAAPRALAGLPVLQRPAVLPEPDRERSGASSGLRGPPGCGLAS